MSKLLRTRKRVAVLGTRNSGKTVLLTSWIHHLAAHDDVRLGSKGQAQVRKFERLVDAQGDKVFPYEAYRDALVHHGTWPRKTQDQAHFACRFERTDWSWHDVELHLVDLPGERVADVRIAVARTKHGVTAFLITSPRSRTIVPWREISSIVSVSLRRLPRRSLRPTNSPLRVGRWPSSQ